MNIYNTLGIARENTSLKMLNRAKTMLRFYENDIDRLNNNLKNLDYSNNDDFFKIRRINEKLTELKEVAKELELAQIVFLDDRLRNKYDDEIRNNSACTLAKFFDKNKIQYSIKHDNDEYYYNNQEEIKLDYNVEEETSAIKNVEYKRYLRPDVYEFNLNANKVRISIMGRLDYSTSFGIKDLGLYKYKVEKARLCDPYSYKHTYNVYTELNIHKISENVDYRDFVINKLFSIKNIKNGLENNYGYIGETLINNNNFYINISKDRINAVHKNQDEPYANNKFF